MKDSQPSQLDSVALARASAPSLLGAALLALVARSLRIDHIGDDCRAWPTLGQGTGLGVVWATAMALLGVGWRRLAGASLPLGVVFLLAALVHGLALLSPPFLSLDPMYYAAIGRAVRAGADAHLPLAQTLPPGDALLSRLPPALRIGSTYGAWFNVLAGALARLAPDVTWAVRSYQLVACAAIFAAAALVAAAVAPARRAQTAAQVLFCPVAIVEASGNGHNDALLALALAAAVFFLRRRRRGSALLALVCGVAIKASAVLPLALVAAAMLFKRWPAARHDRRVRLAALPVVVAGVLLLAVLSPRLGATTELARLIGDARAPLDHCTRSLECLPRSLLRVVLGLPWAAFAVGLGFRVVAALVLLEVARRRAPLAAAVMGLFLYYLYLHPYLQTWYLLALVPLMPFAEPQLRAPLSTFLSGAVFYYAVRIPLACNLAPTTVALKELAEGLIVILPPTLIWLRARAEVGPLPVGSPRQLHCVSNNAAARSRSDNH
jgi:MYXO-CTERM domain-containing protein